MNATNTSEYETHLPDGRGEVEPQLHNVLLQVAVRRVDLHISRGRQLTGGVSQSMGCVQRSATASCHLVASPISKYI